MNFQKYVLPTIEYRCLMHIRNGAVKLLIRRQRRSQGSGTNGNRKEKYFMAERERDDSWLGWIDRWPKPKKGFLSQQRQRQACIGEGKD
jgi:hypothetical protein